MNHHLVNRSTPGFSKRGITGLTFGGKQKIASTRLMEFQEPQFHPDLRLVIMRHGERIDSKFGERWYDTPVAWNNVYNWPPTRNTTFDYILDPPLTAYGAFEASKVGRMLADNNKLKFDFCFCSPALRCIQTAKCVIHGYEGFAGSVPTYICKNLYECYGWMGGPHTNPKFMTIDELNAAGLYCAEPDEHSSTFQSDFIQKFRKVIMNKPIKSWPKQHWDGILDSNDQTPPNEDELSYYSRSALQIGEILSFVDSRQNTSKSLLNHKKQTQSPVNCLIVGHAPTAEVLTVSLLGGQPNLNVLSYMSSYVNFLCMVIAERRQGMWSLNQSPLIGTSINHMHRL